MTRRTNARVAGVAFLVYIAAGITSMIMFRRAGGVGVAGKLAALATHASDAGVHVMLGFLQCFSALALAVTLWALTRDEDADLAILGLVCRTGEGVIAGLSIPGTQMLFWLATSDGAKTLDAGAVQALATYLLRPDAAIPATFFAVGSMAFTWLFLRGRMIPVSLAWLGVIASALLVVLLPISYAGWIKGPITMLVWLPMLAFEVPLGIWLIWKGAESGRAGPA